MNRLFDFSATLRAIRQVLRWTLLAVPVGLVAGSASALFLWSLERATELQWANPWLLWLLPVGGVIVGLLYHYFGRGSEKGNNLLIDEIHQPGGGVPARMAPLVLIGTVITHIFGGSAGREGTAVQMGGSLASTLARWFRVTQENRRLMLMAGVAAGFGAVFGTPLTGAIFAMEVLVIGKLKYDALLPVLVASIVGDLTCTAWGIHHTDYHVKLSAPAGLLSFDPWQMGKVVLAAMAFGLVSRCFSGLTHALQRGFAKLCAFAPWRPAIGAVIVIALVYLLQTRDYLGLGVTPPPGGTVSIVTSFDSGGATPWSWWWKLLFTAITLASGFKGGEVTPLFFIGAACGNALGVAFNEPVSLFAALGFIAVFSGAANTPLACTIMGIELFGAHYTLYFAIVCFIAYIFSGQSGIYSAQRPGVAKH